MPRFIAARASLILFIALSFLINIFGDTGITYSAVACELIFAHRIATIGTVAGFVTHPCVDDMFYCTLPNAILVHQGFHDLDLQVFALLDLTFILG